MTSININPIGIIHSPYYNTKDIPGQGYLREENEAVIEVYKKYLLGMKDLQDFSHLIVSVSYTHLRAHET